MNLSTKPIKPAPKDAFFQFPLGKADDVDPVTHKHCLTISINNTKRLIPCGEPVHITKEEFELLATIGGYLPPSREYDPIRRS